MKASERITEPSIPRGAVLPSPIEIIFRRLDDLESTVQVRKAIEGIPSNLFADLEDVNAGGDEIKGENSGSSTEG